MPNTRKKIIKTVYKNEDDSDLEEAFSDSGSEAEISEQSSSEDAEEEQDASSGEEFKNIKKPTKTHAARKPKFTKSLISKINKQSLAGIDHENVDVLPALFSIKDLTEEDKLLPSILNLSESDSSDDESPKQVQKEITTSILPQTQDIDSDDDNKTEYKDVWSTNQKDKSEEIARKAFLELEQHKSIMEETKASVNKYTNNLQKDSDFNVKELLAQGEDIITEELIPVKKKSRRKKEDSESDMDDWEEVKESKAIPQQGLQLIVELPNTVSRKSKKVDVEMMMKRKLNRVKKEYQVYMHKVHVLCWIGHGNYVSKVLNDQDILAASLSLVPSKECYPGARVDMKYVEQITTWYKDKLTLKHDKNENKFRPKAPPLKDILIGQIKGRSVTAKKFLVYVFVCMLRALGLQCRVMFNFVTLPLRPPSSELCSLSIKPKDDKSVTKNGPTKQEGNKSSSKKKVRNTQPKEKIAQVDGADDDHYYSNDYFTNIDQLDGSNDSLSVQTKSSRLRKPKATNCNTNSTEDDVSPPKRTRNSPSPKPSKPTAKINKEEQNPSKAKHTEKKDAKSTLAASRSKIAPKTSKAKNDSKKENSKTNATEDDVLSPKRTRNSPSPKPSKLTAKIYKKEQNPSKVKHIEKKDVKSKSTSAASRSKIALETSKAKNDSKKNHYTGNMDKANDKPVKDILSPRKTRAKSTGHNNTTESNKTNMNNVTQKAKKDNKLDPPKIVVTADNDDLPTSKYFDNKEKSGESSAQLRPTRKRGRRSTTTNDSQDIDEKEQIRKPVKTRTKSAPATNVEESKYFKDTETTPSLSKKPRLSLTKPKPVTDTDDKKRISHRDLVKPCCDNKSDVTGDLVGLIKGRIREAKEESRKRIVKDKLKKESDDDSDFLPEEDEKNRKSPDSDDDFKPAKLLSPKPGSSKKIDRRVLSSDDDTPRNKIDVWCEVFVEELEQWVCVDVVKGKVHCAEAIYSGATHPVCYVVGWDNNNYLKDLTRRYVPHWNTVTRKQRAEPIWWDVAVQPWLGPNNGRDKEENEQLDRMQLEAPLPKSIAEYKNHPLYALKRHLLKYEALYPPDAATLGFVRGEAVYARECVYVCRSRDTWLKEAKVVRLGEQPYKIVKARPKWDKLSNKCITDKPLEIFGPWQVQDYEPPTAENGFVPRNAYGNVELFKDCMLPKGTVHIKLPGLNKVAKKLNIDCAPAMTGFDFNGGWSHPVYDGFVVCKEFEEIITEAWVNDQEDQERKEREKIDTRVYGHWRRLIKGLLIRERLKHKYGFEEPSTSQDKKKSKGPRLVVKKT